jgi:hypothetical protein
LTQLRKFTDPASSQSYLLGSDSMYGANTMDGKFKVINPKDLVSSATAQGGAQLTERFYVEIPYGVNCTEHIAVDGGAQEYFVAGLDDGTIQILDYTKNKEK